MPQAQATATQTCRLLYFGPRDAGKRANLGIIHSSVPPAQRLALASDDPERQIAFKVSQDGQTWQVLVQSVDAGRERYHTAGRSDEPPFDGVVLVVSSSASQLDQSLASLESLKAYLDSWGLDLMNVPVVLQYNGCDEGDTLPVDRLESLLNPWGLLSFPSSTIRNEGVRETLKAILGLTMTHMKQPPRPTSESRPTSPAKPMPDNTQGSPLGLEYGPPIPGTDIEAITLARGDAIFDEMCPPVVIPVRIPRRLVEGQGPVRILLEVTLEDET